MSKQKTCIIYRDKKSNKITKYSVLITENVDLDSRVTEYNLTSTDLAAEIVNNDDLIQLISIAEENKKAKRSDLKDIEDAIERLRDDFYDMTKDLK